MSKSSQSSSSNEFSAVNMILNLKKTDIVDVWEHNFEEEIYKIMDLIETYNIIAIDTEFPGVLKSPSVGMDEREYEYKIIEENVNSMKVIQIGISIANEKGEVPLPISTWQFNFKFDLSTEPNLSEAIKLLKNSGIDFDTFKEKGIAFQKFSELFISSGIVLNENIRWISFHGGFDFAYLLRLLTNENLPLTLEQFTYHLSIYFPTLYDLKFQIQDFDSIRYDGLSKLGDDIDIRRIGPQHQAGSDSLLTLACFFKLKEVYFKNETAFLIRTHNVLFGLGKGFCENYNYNYNRNNIVVPKEFNETPIIYPGIYNNLIATSPASFYSLKDGYQPYNYNYSSFLTNQFNGFVGNQLQNLVSDLNLLNVNQIYSQNSRTMKHNMKK